MQLPSALAPWARELGLFPPDVASALGAMLPRLASLVGHFSHASATGDEPDGYDGLSRRGTYERLSTFEWALIDVAPNEFLRRAFHGEHSFLNLARKSRQSAASSLAVFDTGPDQVGAPRLAHVALLLVLARRAAAARVEFAFSSHHAAEPFRDLSPTTVAALLDARTALPPTNDSGPDLAKFDEVWMIGSRRLLALPRAAKAAHIEVREMVAPSARRLEVEIADRGSKRSLVLELPDAANCTRILRDPFSVRTVSPVKLSPDLAPQSHLMFGSFGQKLLARGRTGALVAYPIPNSQRAPLGRPRSYIPRRGRLLAAGFGHRALLLLSASEEEVLLQATRRVPAFGGQEGLSFARQQRWVQDVDPNHLGALFCTGIESASGRFFFRLGDFLYRLCPPQHGRPGFVAMECRPITAVALSPGAQTGLAYVGQTAPDEDGRAGGWQVNWQRPNGEIARLALEGNGTFRAFFGPAQRGASASYSTMAIQEKGSSWTLRWRDARYDLEPPARARVIGVMPSEDESSKPVLVLLEDDGRTISLLSRSFSHSFAPLHADVEDIVVDSASPHAACTTRSGDLVVVRLERLRPLMRVLGSWP